MISRRQPVIPNKPSSFATEPPQSPSQTVDKSSEDPVILVASYFVTSPDSLI